MGIDQRLALCRRRWHAALAVRPMGAAAATPSGGPQAVALLTDSTGGRALRTGFGGDVLDAGPGPGIYGAAAGEVGAHRRTGALAAGSGDGAGNRRW